MLSLGKNASNQQAVNTGQNHEQNHDTWQAASLRPINNFFLCRARSRYNPCNRSPSSLASWKELIARQLKISDKASALQLGNVVNDILDGKSEELISDMAGMDPNTPLKFADGNLSLFRLAVAACQVDIAKKLVKMGMNVSVEDESNALVLAAGNGQQEMVKLLLENGAKIDNIDENGITALEMAVRQRQIYTARQLLNNGAQINRPLSNGGTILDLIKYSPDANDKVFAEELITRGAISGLATRRPRD